MPSNSYIDLTLGASDATYIVPADGWIQFRAMLGPFTSVQIETSEKIISWVFNADEYARTYGIYVPIKKGSSFTLNQTSSVNIIFRFIYAVGSAPQS